MTLLLSKKDEVIEFNSHRLYKSKDRNYMYSVLNNTIFEIDQLVLEILKLSGKTTQEVISSLQTDFSKKQIEEVLISMEKGLVIKSEDNDRKIQKLTNHLNINPIISLTLLIVQECNLGCTYCYAEDGEYLDKGKMNNDIAKASIDFLLENSGDRKDIYVVFFGGEPLLNFDLIQSTVKYAKEKEKEFGKTIRYSITTNGTLITNKIRNFLKKMNLQCKLVWTEAKKFIMLTAIIRVAKVHMK
ncbi:radical SAM protein [Lysinibacillus capsici]|uniref:Radical SAM protein n=1 Tax=Lysinibacillus capsici TaxID=2115968 RepID=A0A2X0ZZ63_9BACI|nr:radical SAM protein [Lysinibacillus capsici]SPU38208.1 radical SAM protein [Lysinibacillus capsici]